MVRSHLGRHQRIAAHFTCGELLAHLGFFFVLQTAGHGTGGNENSGQMSEHLCANDKARHDLVTNPQKHRRVECIVAQCDTRRHGDHIAREQRQLHPRFALGDTVTHGRHAARHLRGSTAGAHGVADQGGIALVRLMRRQHVVVRRHNPQITALPRRQRPLIRPCGGKGMGLPAA